MAHAAAGSVAGVFHGTSQHAGAPQVKDKLTGAEEETRRRAEEAERERRRKERRGPFGLFGPKDRD